MGGHKKDKKDENQEHNSSEGEEEISEQTNTSHDEFSLVKRKHPDSNTESEELSKSPERKVRSTVKLLAKRVTEEISNKNNSAGRVTRSKSQKFENKKDEIQISKVGSLDLEVNRVDEIQANKSSALTDELEPNNENLSTMQEMCIQVGSG